MTSIRDIWTGKQYYPLIENKTSWAITIFFDKNNMNYLVPELNPFDMILVVTCTCIWSGTLSQGHFPRFALIGWSGWVVKKWKKKRKNNKDKTNEKLIVLSCTWDIQMSSNKILKDQENQSSKGTCKNEDSKILE